MPKIRLQGGRSLPVNDRDWLRWANEAEADYFRSGQTTFDSGVGFFLGNHEGVPKFSIGDSTASKVTWDGSTLTITGSLVLGSGNFLRSGQTAYDTGTGFWIGNDAGTPKLSVGNSAGNKLTWNGTALTITGQITLTNAAQTFTPGGWAGFSTDPTGDISYIDFGPFVVMWVNTALTGLSDEVFMSFSTGMPTAIRPTAQRDIRCVLLDENFVCGGVTRVDPSGAVAFFLEEVQAGAPPPANTVGFDNIFTDPSATGSKGLPSGWMVIYPK